MSVLLTNIFTASNYTLLQGRSPKISQNFMNSNDNKTNRQGYDFHHETPVILVRCIVEVYFDIKYVLFNCCIEQKEKLNIKMIYQVMNHTNKLRTGENSHELQY
jgi:hypothetical protein